jgi:hypothetical protein
MATELRAPAIALLLIATVGCATSDQGVNQGMKSAGAAAAGGLTTLGCMLVGGSARACTQAGAAVGAAAWVSMRPNKTFEERVPVPTAQPRPERAMIIIRQFDVAPKEVPRGGTLSATTLYDLKIPSKTQMLPVTQKFTLVKDGQVISETNAIVGELKDHGRYEVAWDFPIPGDAELGSYELKQVLEARTRSPERRQATFQVVD